MELPESRSTVKFVVIVGYVLVVVTMIVGLWAVYRNLVDFSEKRIRDEDRYELIVVGNIINRLYEVESMQSLFTSENAENYFERYRAIRPEIYSGLDTLRQLSKDLQRVAKLDSIEVLLGQKEENLGAIAVLMDSIRKAPEIIRKTTVNTIAPKRLNAEIDGYLGNKNPTHRKTEKNATDTTVIKRERGLFRRIGDAIAGRQDSTVIIQNRPSALARDEIRLVMDTIVNMVRYSERLNLENQRRFQDALFQKQSVMNHTNHILTSKIDDLLKTIEQEEIEKSLRLLEEKKITLDRSYGIVSGVSLLAVAIALISGLLFLTDINRSQRYKKRLEESNRRINQLLRSREKLMLSISHDIKAPMGSILGYIELMESGVDENTRETYLSNMKKSSDHVLQLVTNLLDYQKIESGTWLRKEMNFNVFDLVENTATSFRPIAVKKRLSYYVNNQIPRELVAFSDPFMIREIYSNLISNAIKYTPQGKVEVFAGYTTENGQSILTFSVKDTGLGIDPEYQSFIFQELTQIKSEEFEPATEGSGLGLAITKGLVEQLDGKIGLRSERGSGSEFFVALPLEPSRTMELLDTEDTSADVNVENISVLIVDDDPTQLAMVSEMLKPKKINAMTEVDSGKVLSVLKNHVFDLIFIDIQMPRINGFTLVKQILDSGLLQSKSTPIIALSAKSDISACDFKRSGFTDFINKPFTSGELFSLINKCLNLKLVGVGESNGSLKSVAALIDVVKEDKAGSLEILKAFVRDTEKNSGELQEKFAAKDADKASHLAHKMLPLFKMMGDENLSDILLRIDRKQAVPENEKEWAIGEIQTHVQAARSLIDQIENS